MRRRWTVVLGLGCELQHCVRFPRVCGTMQREIANIGAGSNWFMQNHGGCNGTLEVTFFTRCNGFHRT